MTCRSGVVSADRRKTARTTASVLTPEPTKRGCAPDRLVRAFCMRGQCGCRVRLYKLKDKELVWFDLG